MFKRNDEKIMKLVFQITSSILTPKLIKMVSYLFFLIGFNFEKMEFGEFFPSRVGLILKGLYGHWKQTETWERCFPL